MAVKRFILLELQSLTDRYRDVFHRLRKVWRTLESLIRSSRGNTDPADEAFLLKFKAEIIETCSGFIQLHTTVSSPLSPGSHICLCNKKVPANFLAGWKVSSPYCAWLGVGRDELSRVISLDLTGMNLSGMLSTAARSRSSKTESYADHKRRDDIRHANILAARAVVDVVRISLGPKGMD